MEYNSNLGQMLNPASIQFEMVPQLCFILHIFCSFVAFLTEVPKLSWFMAPLVSVIFSWIPRPKEIFSSSVY